MRVRPGRRVVARAEACGLFRESSSSLGVAPGPVVESREKSCSPRIGWVFVQKVQ